MLCIAAGLLVFAADPEFAVDVCGPQVWMNHAGVKVASQTGKLGADDAIMIEITKTDLTANWVGVGLHGGHMDTEMYVAYWDSDIVVVHNYFSTSDSFPSVPSDTPVTIYYTDSTSVRFYRKMYNPEGVHTNPIQRGIAMIFSWAKGQGQPGAGWTTHGTTNETRGTGQVIPAGSDVCTHPQNSSFVPSSCGFAVVDTYIDLSLNVGMYDEEPAVAFHWNMILPTTAPPYNWIGFGEGGRVTKMKGDHALRGSTVALVNSHSGERTAARYLQEELRKELGDDCVLDLMVFVRRRVDPADGVSKEKAEFVSKNTWDTAAPDPSIKQRVTVTVDGKTLDQKRIAELKSVVCTNIDSYASGMKPWRHRKNCKHGFSEPVFHDGKLEVCGYFGPWHLGLSQIRMRTSKKIGQGSVVVMEMSPEADLDYLRLQIDGEAINNLPEGGCTIRITRHPGGGHRVLTKRSKLKRAASVVSIAPDEQLFHRSVGSRPQTGKNGGEAAGPFADRPPVMVIGTISDQEATRGVDSGVMEDA
eukprot:gene2553-3961_t